MNLLFFIENNQVPTLFHGDTLPSLVVDGDPVTLMIFDLLIYSLSAALLVSLFVGMFCLQKLKHANSSPS